MPPEPKPTKQQYNENVKALLNLHNMGLIKSEKGVELTQQGQDTLEAFTILKERTNVKSL